MHSCICTSGTTIASFFLFSLVYSSPLTTLNQHPSSRMHIPITQTLNPDAAMETNQPQNQPPSTEQHISSTHPQHTNTTLQRRQRHILHKTPQPQNQNSPTEIYISPIHPKNASTTHRTNQQRHAHEETPQPENQNSSTVIQISPAQPQDTNATPKTRQQRHVTTDVLQLPNGPPLRFQRPRLSQHVTRHPIRTQLGQQSHDNLMQSTHGDILQQRHGDVMQQPQGSMVQKSDLLLNSDSKRPHGAPQKFCNMFGCDCAPPANSRCCVGYRYDKRSKKCRQLL